jgi:hypothetical protein
MTQRQESSSTGDQQVAPLKYVDLLQQSEKDKSSEENKYASDQAKLQLDGDILETRKSISKQKQTVADLKASKDFDPADILTAMTELEDLENGLTKLQALKEELF